MADVGVKRPDCVGGGLSGPSYEVTPWSLGAIVPLSSSEIVIRITWVIVDTPGQARLSQISLSLINQNIHLSRDILFIIAGSFIGGVERAQAERSIEENGFWELDMSRKTRENTAEKTAQGATNRCSPVVCQKEIKWFSPVVRVSSSGQ